MNRKKIIKKNIIMIGLIITLIFLSQSSYFQKITYDLKIKKIEKWPINQFKTYLFETKNWVKTNIPAAISGEVVKRSQLAQEEMIKQKDATVKKIWDNFKIFFQEKIFRTFNVK